MTSLEDKATESPTIDLLRDAQYSGFYLADDELVSADELSDEDEFPQYGDFLPVRTRDDDEQPVMYVECPQGLAQELVETGIEPGDGFRIDRAQKVDGVWNVDVSEGVEMDPEGSET